MPSPKETWTITPPQRLGRHYTGTRLMFERQTLAEELTDWITKGVTAVDR